MYQCNFEPPGRIDHIVCASLDNYDRHCYWTDPPDMNIHQKCRQKTYDKETGTKGRQIYIISKLRFYIPIIFIIKLQVPCTHIHTDDIHNIKTYFHNANNMYSKYLTLITMSQSQLYKLNFLLLRLWGGKIIVQFKPNI